jgi:hypothetical protein
VWASRVQRVVGQHGVRTSNVENGARVANTTCHAGSITIKLGTVCDLRG